jgi:ElaA protein
VHLDAQAHLEQWYGAMGFETVGGVFLEAGIEHVAMVRRPARA